MKKPWNRLLVHLLPVLAACMLAGGFANKGFAWDEGPGGLLPAADQVLNTSAAPTLGPAAEATPTAAEETPAPTEGAAAEETPAPTPVPTTEPAAEATPTAAEEETPAPTEESAADETPAPTPVPTTEPAAEATPTAAEETPAPTEESAAEETPAPTPVPTTEPAAEATPTAATGKTPAPTGQPSPEPAASPAAQESGDFAVSVSMTPASAEPVKTGQTGSFLLQIGVNDPNHADATADVRIYLRDGQVRLPDFEATGSVAFYGQTIALKEADGLRYLEILGVPNGDTRTKTIRFQYSNGVTPPTTLTIAEEDIEIETAIPGHQVRSGGSLSFISTFYWRPVQKTVGSGALTIGADRKLEGGNVAYRVNAASYNHTGAGDIHTAEYTLVETLTLPRGITFPEGTPRAVHNPASATATLLVDMANGDAVRIADFERAGAGDAGTTGTAGFRLTAFSRRSFTIEYTCTRTAQDDPSLPLYSPGIGVVLYTAPLAVGEEALGGGEIQNEVSFEAIPVVTPYNPARLTGDSTLIISADALTDESHRSSASVATRIEPPEPQFSLDKRLLSAQSDTSTGEVTLVYELTCVNTGAADLALDIVEQLPTGLVFAPQQAFTGTVSGPRGEESVRPGEVDVEGGRVTWPGTRVPYRGTFTAQIEARTAADAAERRLTNTLRATVTGTDRTKEATHGYDYALPKSDFIVKKSHRVYSGADPDRLTDGGLITYTVSVENTGSRDITLRSVTDECPGALRVDAASCTRDGQPIGGVEVTPGVLGGQTVSFPVPEDALAPGKQVVYTYDARLETEGRLAPGGKIVNTVKAMDALGRTRSCPDEVTYALRSTDLVPFKEGGTARFVSGPQGRTYAIDYALRIENRGDAMPEGETFQLTDRMQGALYVNPETFFITLTRSDGSTQQIHPDVQRVSGPAGDDYRIEWPLTGMPACSPGGEPPQFRYAYTAYVDLEPGGVQHVQNALVLEGYPESVGPAAAAAAPAPTAQKRITDVVCTAHSAAAHDVPGMDAAKHRRVHPGDAVTYEVVFANDGLTEMVSALIVDTLPTGNLLGGAPYAWRTRAQAERETDGYVAKVEILPEGFPTQAQFGYALSQDTAGTLFTVSASDEDAASAAPKGFTFPAGARLTLRIQLVYPAGAAYDRHFLHASAAGEYAQAGPFENKATLRGADRAGNAYACEDGASVYPQPADAVIAKSADKSLLRPGDEVTFTLKGRGNNRQWLTLYATTGARLVEDLTPFREGFELIAYTIGRADAGRYTNAYSFTLLDQPARACAFDRRYPRVVLEEPIDLSTIPADKLKVVWDFGDTKSLWISGTGGLAGNWPSVTLRVKTDAPSMRLTNTATLSYNGGRASESRAPVAVVAGDRLTKRASLADGEPIPFDGEYARLSEGDTISYTIGYRNVTGEPEVFTPESPLTLTDVLTTRGLAQSASAVRFALRTPEGETAGGAYLMGPAQVEVTAADVESPQAKRITFQIAGSIAPGEAVELSYDVLLGEGYRLSAADTALGRRQAYEEDLQTPEQVSHNLYQAHNLVYFVGEDGLTVHAQTPYCATPSGKQLYFGKSVKDIGRLEAEEDGAGDALTLRSADYAAGVDRLGAPRENFVKYVLVVCNDPSSGADLVVESVTDALPPRVRALRDDKGGRQFVLLGFVSANSAINTANNVSAVPLLSGNADASFTPDQIRRYMHLPGPIAEAGLTAKGCRAIIDRQDYVSVTFRLCQPGSTRPLALKPGEFTAVCYGVCLDRTQDSGRYVNTAVLRLQDGAGAWESVGDSLRSVFVARQKNPNSAYPQNAGSGVPAGGEGTAFQASVALAAPSYRLGMTKTANAFYRAAEGERAFLEARTKDAGTGGLTDWSQYALSDVVEWKITVTNNSSVEIDDFVLTEAIPYPHEAIAFADANGRCLALVQSDQGALLPGVLTDARLPDEMGSFGKTGAVLSSEPFALAAGETNTFYVYTRYSQRPQVPISYVSVTNRAEVGTRGGRTFQNVSGCNPVLNAAGQIVAGTQSATVSAAYSAAMSAYKQVRCTDADGGEQTAQSNAADRTVQAGKRGDTVRYTLHIENDDALNDARALTIIDPLPVRGDYGVINLATPRESAFAVDLAEDPQIAVQVRADGEAAWRSLRPTGAGFDLSRMAADEYLVLYTDHARHAGGDPVDVWHFDTQDAHQHWFESREGLGRVTSILFYLPRALETRTQLRVSFDCVIGTDAFPGEYAWNSFGYRYRQVAAGQPLTDDAPALYAEPAKVGVTIRERPDVPELPETGGTGPLPLLLSAGAALMGAATLRRAAGRK